MTLKQDPMSSSEQQADYKQHVRATPDEALVEIFINAYLERDFPTPFERWMAEADVFEFKRRLINRGML